MAMTSDLAVNLLDTFPGRMLIDWWGEWRALHPEFSSAGQYADSIDTEDYSGRVAMVLHMYLYGGDFQDVIDLDTTDPDIVEMSEAVAAALCSPSRETLLSPQSHHGNLTEFRTLSVANRHRPSALPDGAFWTATKFACGNDAWLLHGEHDAERSPLRYDVHFDPAEARIARVDSAPSWEALLTAHPREHEGTVFPDWQSIAQEWDAVHVSLSGLLCAEPLISQVPYTGEDPSGYTHCQSGPYVGVAEWAVPSTAWLRPSGHMRVEPTALAGGQALDDR